MLNNMFVKKSEKKNEKATFIASLFAFYEVAEKHMEQYVLKVVNNYLFTIKFDIKKFDFHGFMKTTGFWSQKEYNSALFGLPKALKAHSETLEKNFEFSETDGLYGFVLRTPFHEKKEATKEDIIYTSALYYILEEKACGNQWTMVCPKEIDFFQKNDFVEVFASPYNTRSKNFCSLFESDKCFGSFGDNRNFIKKLLEDEKFHFKNLAISPPSGEETAKYITESVLKLLESGKKYNIVLGLSLKHSDLKKKLSESKFLVEEQVNLYCFDIYRNKLKSMVDRPWYRFYLTNDIENKLNFPKLELKTTYDEFMKKNQTTYFARLKKDEKTQSINRPGKFYSSEDFNKNNNDRFGNKFYVKRNNGNNVNNSRRKKYYK